MLKNHTKPILMYFVMASLLILPVVAENNNQQGNQNDQGNRENKRMFAGDGEDNNDKEKPRLIMAREDRQEIKEQRKEAKCKLIGDKVQLKVDRFSTNRELYIKRYSGLVERISAWADRLDKDGYDVKDLKAALEVLNTKIDNLSKLHDTLLTKLDNLNDFECGNSDGAYAQALQESRNALADVRQAVLDIRKYFLEEVKPLVKDLREQVRNDKEKADESSESNE
jgi:hypothetical protein